VPAAAPVADKPAIAVIALGGLCSVIFAYQVLLAFKYRGSLPILGAGSRMEAVRAGALEVQADLFLAEPWRLLSSVFVHFGLVHFALNMMGFVWLGKMAERLVGPARTITAFVVTGVSGSAATMALAILTGAAVGEPSGSTISAGASGGILGVMGLVVGVLIRRRDPRWKPFVFQSIFYTFLFGIAVNTGSGPISVNNAAHLGGLVAGVLFGLLWGGRGAREGTFTRVVGGVLLAISVASLGLAEMSERWRALSGS
jgi:membrane associated rhomboid family serine protease